MTEVKSSEFEAGVKRRLSLIRLARANRTSLALNAISIAFPQISQKSTQKTTAEGIAFS
jgi:hypothetical protein